MRAVAHYEVSEFRPVILEIPATCLLATAPRAFAFGWESVALRPQFFFSPHREDYTQADAFHVCEMLNARLEYLAKFKASQPADPLGGERGVSSPSNLPDGDAFELDNATAAYALTASESY